jgi:hypothetical protein
MFESFRLCVTIGVRVLPASGPMSLTRPVQLSDDWAVATEPLEAWDERQAIGERPRENRPEHPART